MLTSAKPSLERLWAPWRKKYLMHPKAKGCIFCSKPKSKKDAENLILSRGKQVYSILNLYPYNNGHLMVVPYRHTGDILSLTQTEISELFQMAQKYARKLKKTIRPHGFNIGFNVGRAGGAGLERHLHLHVVPRWVGDSNFMPVVGGTKVISQSLAELRRMLLA